MRNQMEKLKKFLYNSLTSMVLMISISCTSYSNTNEATIQNIEFNSSEVFPQGGSFTLIKQDKTCLLYGNSYSDYGNFEYRYYFNGESLLDGTFVQNKYKEPLFVNDSPTIQESIISTQLEDKKVSDNFLKLKDYISEKNMQKCTFK